MWLNEAGVDMIAAKIMKSVKELGRGVIAQSRDATGIEKE